jgi:hypothetical protein
LPHKKEHKEKEKASPKRYLFLHFDALCAGLDTQTFLSFSTHFQDNGGLQAADAA